MAYAVELCTEVERELEKLDAQHARRILKFLHQRLAKLDDPRAIVRHCTGRGLGSSGNIG